MRRKICSIVGLIFLFVIYLIFLYKKQDEHYIREVFSPCEFKLENGEIYHLSECKTFDSQYSTGNKELAKKLGLSEEECFILGNFAKYWAQNTLEGRKVVFLKNDFLYNKLSYKTKFLLSPYGIKDDKFSNTRASQKLVETIRRTKYQILDVETDKYYPIDSKELPKNYIIVKRGYLHKKNNQPQQKRNVTSYISQNFKIILADFTLKTKPDRNCETDICKEILNSINSAESSIDIAIYGYSSIPKIENAIKNAMEKGVKVRLVYDIDKNNTNIYENTFDFVSLIKNARSDKDSKDVSAIMHNKFYIFDNKKVITGSANLSHTDMSGFNSNALIVINSPEYAKIYTQEFEQMYFGKFHTDKIVFKNHSGIYFSPQDKTITNGIVPYIKQAKIYIYIPIFVITEKQIVNELINAKSRGVDVKIIADAVNASSKYSKINELRTAGIPVKIENYAGKLHSKTIIIDDRYLLLGSMNFSKSGEYKNDENFIVLNNSEMAKFYKQFFIYLWEKIPDKWLKYYPKAEGFDSVGSCFDGIDNDYDGKIDSEDEGCKKSLGLK